MFSPINKKIFGEVKTIIYYDTPLSFLCKDFKNDQYIVFLNDEDDLFSSWIAARITEDYINELINNDSSVNDLFLNNKFETSSLIECTFKNGKPFNTIVKEMENIKYWDDRVKVKDIFRNIDDIEDIYSEIF